MVDSPSSHTTSPRRSLATRLEDLALVADLLRGQEAAVERFLERMECLPRFLNSIARRTGRQLRPDETAELVQEVIARMWTRLPRFEGRASLESWSYSFCTFVLKDHGRWERSSTERTNGECIQAEACEDTPPPFSWEERDRVRSALGALGRPFAQAVHLRHFEELPFDAIAARLAVPTSTAKSRYYEGMARLRRRLRSSGAP